MVQIKQGMSGISGRVQGIYDKDTKGGVIKRGITKNDKKYQIFEIGVASKSQDGDWTNGKSIRVMAYGQDKIEVGDNVGLIGRFQPDNYTDKDGKEVKGLMFVCNTEDMFTPDAWDTPSKPEIIIENNTQEEW